jgi:hypothetical protein
MRLVIGLPEELLRSVLANEEGDPWHFRRLCERERESHGDFRTIG